MESICPTTALPRLCWEGGREHREQGVSALGLGTWGHLPALCQVLPQPYGKELSKHEKPCICNDSNKTNKNHPEKHKPRPLLTITNWTGCSLPEISWAISKQNYPQLHVCPIILIVISAAPLQACSLRSGSSSSPQNTAFPFPLPSLFFFFFF